MSETTQDLAILEKLKDSRNRFFNEIGFDYVSCSPFRVPIARLAAAQSRINT